MTLYNTYKREISVPLCVIQTHIFIKRAEAGPRVRPRGHFDRPRNH